VYGFSLGLILILSLLAIRLAGKTVSDVTYLVSSGMLNLNSINQSKVNCFDSTHQTDCSAWTTELVIDNYIKYSLDFLRPIKTAEAFEAVDWPADLPQ